MLFTRDAPASMAAPLDAMIALLIVACSPRLDPALMRGQRILHTPAWVHPSKPALLTGFDIRTWHRRWLGGAEQ